ncbi:MAG: hypothetical protein ACFB2Z_02455 [Maricaulaceae bacterium]
MSGSLARLSLARTLVLGWALGWLSSCASPPLVDPPTVQLLVLRGDWSPSSLALDEKLAAAFPDPAAVGLAPIVLDATTLKQWRKTRAEVDAAGLSVLADRYKGAFGLAIFVAPDTGEPLGCLTALRPEDSFRRDFRRAQRALRRPPGARPSGRPCPAAAEADNAGPF